VATFGTTLKQHHLTHGGIQHGKGKNWGSGRHISILGAEEIGRLPVNSFDELQQQVFAYFDQSETLQLAYDLLEEAFPLYPGCGSRKTAQTRGVANARRFGAGLFRGALYARPIRGGKLDERQPSPPWCQKPRRLAPLRVPRLGGQNQAPLRLLPGQFPIQ